jgi:hypothetical protein
MVLDVPARRLVIDVAMRDRPLPDLRPRGAAAHRLEGVEGGVLALLAERGHRDFSRPGRPSTFAGEA